MNNTVKHFKRNLIAKKPEKNFVKVKELFDNESIKDSEKELFYNESIKDSEEKEIDYLQKQQKKGNIITVNKITNIIINTNEKKNEGNLNKKNPKENLQENLEKKSNLLNGENKRNSKEENFNSNYEKKETDKKIDLYTKNATSLSIIDIRKSLSLNEEKNNPFFFNPYEEFRSDFALVGYFWRFLALSIAILEEDNHNIANKPSDENNFKKPFFRRFTQICTAPRDQFSFSNNNFTNKLKNEENYLSFNNNFLTEDKNRFTFDSNLKTKKYKEYTKDNIPYRLKSEKIGFEKLNIKIKNYESKIFSELRTIDNIELEDILLSLNPDKNFDNLNFASGGRSDCPILFTYDRKFLIKIITKKERELFLKILREFRERLINGSILSKIYGLFDFIINHKEENTFIILKNMNVLPRKSTLFTFDLKGSTVDRRIIPETDLTMLINKDRKMIQKYKNEILKDNDLKDLNIKLNLTDEDMERIIKQIEDDTAFLNSYNITDYSLLLTINEFKLEDYEKFADNIRIFKSRDDKYLYSLSIIDFLSQYDVKKKWEVIFKNIKIYMKGQRDYNISACNPIGYSFRFNSFIKMIINNGKN